MNRRRLLLVVACASVLALLPLLVMSLVPAEEVAGVAVRALQREGYTLTARRFQRVFPVGISGEDVLLRSSRGDLVKFDTFAARLKLAPLLIGKVAVGFRGTIRKGEIEGKLFFRPRQGLSIELRDVELEDVPFFRTVGLARAAGKLNASGALSGTGNDQAGELKVWSDRGALNGVKIGGVPLPDSAYDRIRGMCRIRSGRGTLESFTLQGMGLYLRLRGDIPLTPSAPLNLNLELMPRPEFLQSQKLVFLLLAKYLTTPGHYLIPIRGTLADPAIQ